MSRAIGGAMQTAGKYELVAFDVDGTLVGNHQRKVVWELFNEHYSSGGTPQGLRFSAFMEREITYAEWVELDVLGWIMAGARRSEMAGLIRSHLYMMPGAEQTIRYLHRHGYRLAVISGSLDLTLDVLFPDHPFEEVHTNRLVFDRQGYIRDWHATSYDMEGKARALREIAARMSIPLENTVFVGDNFNDIYAMRTAGLAVAYDPKADLVSEVADRRIFGDLGALVQVLQQLR